MNVKDLLKKHLIGETYRFRTKCLFPIDVTGTITDLDILSGEMVLFVTSGEKIFKIGMNSPSLTIDNLATTVDDN